jgi:hypothetical protein
VVDLRCENGLDASISPMIKLFIYFVPNMHNHANFSCLLLFSEEGSVLIYFSNEKRYAGSFPHPIGVKFSSDFEFEKQTF